MPISLATWEAEIRRIRVQSQTRQIVPETLYRKDPTHKRAGTVVQVVEYLLSKCEAPGSKPSTIKK
jgi:hypothetical protein